MKKHTTNLIQKYSLQQIPELPKKQTPTVDLEQESKKTPSEILKIKKEQTEKQKMPKFTTKSTNKAALKEYDQKSALYQTMHANKSFNKNPANHRLYHALMEALIEDENAMDKGVVDTKPSTTKETPKGRASSKSSKTGKYASAKEPVKEPIAKVVMDDVGDDVVQDEDQPQDASEPKTAKTPNLEWFTQPPRPHTLDPEWNKRQVILDKPEQPCIELEYHFQECFNTLTDKLDWNNPKGDRHPFDLSKPLPLQGHLGHLTVAVDYFFNNDLEYLKSFDPERTPTKVGYDKDALKGIKHWGERLSTNMHGYGHLEENMVKRADRQFYKFKEGDFVDLHLNDIEDMLLLVVQHKLFHLTDNDIIDFIMALCMFTRSLIIKKRVKDLKLGVESYQKKLNITLPQ
ncbi:hypothetical protein Tco_1310121 [Tanacetum coccineum]